MERFAHQYPHIRFNVHTLGGRQVEEGLRLGLYDIAVTNKTIEGPEFDVTEVHRADAVCVAALNHRFSRLDVVALSDLSDQVLISLPSHDALEMALHDAFSNAGIECPTAIETTYTSSICTFASQGLGVGVISPYMAYVFKDRLCIRPFRPSLPVATYVAFARFSPASELGAYFFEILIELCKDDWYKN